MPVNKQIPISDYLPGQCNIGEDEILRRIRMGYMGLGISLLLAALFLMFQPARELRLLLFIPLFYTFSGFLQARKRFCYVFGWKGVFSLHGLNTIQKVKQDDARRQDRIQAFRLVIQIFVLSALLALAFYCIRL